MHRNLFLTIIVSFLVFMSVSCGGDDTEDTANNFPNMHDGLNWSDASSVKMTWNGAVTYCENLGGRLPTISELRTLIQNCPATKTGGECGVTDECLSYEDCWNGPCDGCEYDESGKYSVFGTTESLWSSSAWSDSPSITWGVGFSYGVVGNVMDSVRCVK